MCGCGFRGSRLQGIEGVLSSEKNRRVDRHRARSISSCSALPLVQTDLSMGGQQRPVILSGKDILARKGSKEEIFGVLASTGRALHPLFSFLHFLVKKQCCCLELLVWVWRWLPAYSLGPG